MTREPSDIEIAEKKRLVEIYLSQYISLADINVDYLGDTYTEWNDKEYKNARGFSSFRNTQDQSSRSEFYHEHHKRLTRG